MELFNAIFETFWTFAGSVVLLALAGAFTCEIFNDIGNVIKHYKKGKK